MLRFVQDAATPFRTEFTCLVVCYNLVKPDSREVTESHFTVLTFESLLVRVLEVRLHNLGYSILWHIGDEEALMYGSQVFRESDVSERIV